MIFVCLLTSVLLGSTTAAFYETFSGKEISAQRFEQWRLNNLVPYCAIEVQECSYTEFRRTDATCNNLNYPPRGAQLTPYHRMLPPTFSTDGNHRVSKTGQPLPNARALRVGLMSDGRLPSPRFTQLVTNLNVFVTGDTTSVHDTVNYISVTRTCCQPGGTEDPRCQPIFVDENDVHLRRSNVRCLNLTRAITYQRLGCVPNTIPPERINTATPLLDMSGVYGHGPNDTQKAREGSGGRFRADMIRGKEWPPHGSLVCVNNEPPMETRCHNTPASGSNSLIGINLFTIWFYRNHNAIARKLQDLNPCWNDNQIFVIAKEINIAMMNQMIYYELMPLMLGYEYMVKNRVISQSPGHVNDYDDTIEPRVSIEFVTGTRWFHTMQEGRLKFYTRDGRLYDEQAAVDYSLRTGALMLNNSLAGLTQGAFRQPCADVDYVLDPDMGERVVGRLQFASDVLSSDIMKGRDVGLPPYNDYRKLCRLPVARTFGDLLKWMPKEQVEVLASAYESVDDVDIMAGIISERPMDGGIVGPTLACFMTDQLLRWRRGDRFWYENTVHPGAFSLEQLYEIRKMTLSRLICDHGEDMDAIQPDSLLLAGPGNEMVKCSALPSPNLEVFRDNNCNMKSYTNDYFNTMKLSTK